MSVSVTVDETEKKRAELRDKRNTAVASGDSIGAQSFDPTALRNPDPNYRYRWINKHASRVSRYKSAGYEVVSTTDQVSSVLDDSRTTEGTIKQNDDMILMRTTRANYEARRKRIQERGDTWERAGHEQALDRINKIARDGRLAKEHQDVAFDESGRR